MIRRLLSLVFGVIVFWVGYQMMCGLVFDTSTADLILNCSQGVSAFYKAAAAALVPLLAMVFVLSKLPLVKRAWANVGCAFGSALILLIGGIFLGAGQPTEMTLFLSNPPLLRLLSSCLAVII